MKKTLLVLILAVIVATSAFAEHPVRQSLGVVIKWDNTWADWGQQGTLLAISFASPNVPFNWAIYADINPMATGRFRIGLTGDEYLLDASFVPGLNLGLFLGFGVYTGLAFGVSSSKDDPRGASSGYYDDDGYYYDDYSESSHSTDVSALFNIGARLPIGIYIIPGNFVEIYFSVVPSAGLGINLAGGGGVGFDGGLGLELGIRVWF